MAANIEFVREENAYIKSWWRRGEGCIGSFDIKGWKDYGYLYMLNDFDEKYYAHVLLKQGEMLFRYETDATKISGMRPITKINIERGIIYFNEDLYSDDDKNLVFEKRGVKLIHLSLSDSVYKAYVNDSKYRLHKFEDGGEIKKYNSYEDFVNDNIGSKKYVLVYGSGGQSQPLDGATKDSIEKQFKGLIYNEFIDSEFYNNYASDDVKDEYKSLIKEFYNSLLESPKKFTSFWVNNMTKSTHSNSLYELKNKYKNIEENYNYSTGDKRLDSKSKYVLAIKNSVGQIIKYEPIEKPESYEFYIFSEFKNKMSNKLKKEYMEYRKKYLGEDFKFSDKMAKGGKTESEDVGINYHHLYIEYLNPKKKFAKDKKEFKGETAYKQAISWGRKNIRNFNSDMVKFKMADGGMMSKGGETKRVRKMYSDGGEVAMTILQQLGGTNRLNAMMGAYNFINIGNGVSFKIKNARANYIKITLTSMDLYDVEIGRIRGHEYKVVKKAEGLYFDQLKGFIESSTGMYMSFSEGGMINVKTEDGEVLKYKKDEDEMYVEVDERTKNYLTDIVLVLSRDFRKVGEKYIFWYDEMSDEDIEELENLFKTPFRIKKNKSRSDDFADGGVLSDSDYIIKDDESDRYFSMGLSDGKVKWNDSQDMAYMFNKREAESLKSKLELDGYSNLSVQKYNKDWWKMENGGDVKYSYGGRLDVGRYYKTKYGKQVRYLGKTKEPEVGAFSSKTDGVSNIRYDEIEGKASIFGNGGGIKEKYLFDVYKLDEYGSIIPSSKKRVSVIRVNLSSAKDSVYKKYPYKEYRIELFDKERV